MDTSDPTITFDVDGVCSYCRNFFDVIKPNWHANEKGLAKIAPLIDRIKKQRAKRDHDCLIGVSGGLDSTYIAYSAVKRFGLRPLLFHVDAGWNTDAAVSNIQKLVDVLGLDLVTHVVNWQEMKDLQRAFFKSGVPAQDTPQDVAFFSALFNFANDHGFKYIIKGAIIQPNVFVSASTGPILRLISHSYAISTNVLARFLSGPFHCAIS
jgi:asparagine synthetase B (glutamine-hydrolysing)